MAKRKSGMPNWLLPDDQEVEEWNLGSEEDPKMIKINKHLKKALKDKAWNLFLKFRDVFAWEHTDLKGVDPEVKEEIDNLLKAGFIAEVKGSDWLFPIVVVPKKNGKLRACMDYRKINAQTSKDPLPLPFTNMMMDEIAGHEMYSFMDGYSGYNKLKIAPEDREKTTFITEWGAFMYLVMSFGLCNAPATFQRCMMEIFNEFLHKLLAIFVDDLTIYSTEELHILFLEMVFQQCREKRICLNPFKSVFMVWKGQLLGHVVSRHGIKMVANKVKCIQLARPPKNVLELSSFLRYISFYRRFIHMFATKAIVLYILTQKDVKFIWTSECQESFQALKDAVSIKPILRQLNWEVIFHVHVDASGVAMGAILAQPEGKANYPMYFANRQFSKAEQGYSTTGRSFLTPY
ncbi:hypothetical protein L7F22_043205 [Adiantum nelumboides]|nr:hypothetical protein [Adiantum nelumboides]